MKSQLFSPIQIGTLPLKNRMAVSSMCMYSCRDGFATDFHLVHLGNRALGGFGLVLQEATAISPEGRITYRDLGIWKEDHIAPLKRVVDFCHQQDTKIGIQLAHAGRKASHLPPHEGRAEVKAGKKNGWPTVSASSIPFRADETPPESLNLEGIEKIKEDFVRATRRAKEAGYDVIEIHAAHGYLLHQFYSPLSNNRSDQYGGSFENRIRLLLEVTRLVREEWGKTRPLLVRISATDWVPNGWTIEDSIALAKRLKTLGVDAIDTSTGGNITADIPNHSGYQVGFAADIKKYADIKTGAVGLIRTVEESEKILQNQQADFILYGRKALRDPYFPLHAAQKMNVEVSWPIQYERGKEGWGD